MEAISGNAETSSLKAGHLIDCIQVEPTDFKATGWIEGLL
jgi:hypothetical protein